MSYTVVNQLKDEVSQAVAASQTNQVVSKVFGITTEESKNLLVKVVCSGVTLTNAITAKLQDSFDGGTTWEDAGSVSVTGDGNFEIEHDHSEASTGCLWPTCRITITTGVSDEATVDAVYVTRR